MWITCAGRPRELSAGMTWWLLGPAVLWLHRGGGRWSKRVDGGSGSGDVQHHRSGLKSFGKGGWGTVHSGH